MVLKKKGKTVLDFFFFFLSSLGVSRIYFFPPIMALICQTL